jgi:hypothetical protein
MLTPTPRRSALLVWLCLSAPLVAAAERPSREQIAKQAKAATAFVQAGFGSGSGFCVHPSGWFVTNEHVMQRGGPPNQPTKLVLDAGLPTQQVLTAKVVRLDKQLDLALLKVEAAKPFPALTLGSDKELGELAELIALGFPFGTALGRPGEFPAISVNVGSVTSLRRDREGKLHRIQMDAALNPGNSGGPVLDRGGKVVGVVVSGVRGAGINMAIPVSHLERFLARPEVTFTPPAVRPANQYEPLDFVAKVTSLVPLSRPLEVELVLGSGRKARRVPMKLAEGSYRARAVPVTRPVGPAVFPVTVSYADGSVRGLAEDREITAGSRRVKLSQVQAVRLGQRTETDLVSGRTVRGALSGLDTLTLKVGKQALDLRLADAVSLNVEPPEDPAAVSCAVVARLGGQDVGGQSVPLFVAGLARPPLEALADGKFVKPIRSPVPVSYLRAVSSPGDFIGQGKSYSYRGEELMLRRFPRGVMINVGGWTVQFGGPNNEFLHVGEYRGAKRFPFSGDSPGIEFFGNGRGSNKIAGKFVVWELDVKGNDVTRLAIDFIQHSEETKPPLYGMIRFNSSFH